MIENIKDTLNIFTNYGSEKINFLTEQLYFCESPNEMEDVLNNMSGLGSHTINIIINLIYE